MDRMQEWYTDGCSGYHWVPTAIPPSWHNNRILTFTVHFKSFQR